MTEDMHFRILESAINPRPKDEEPIAHILIELMTHLEPGGLESLRTQLRKHFCRGELWIVQAVCYKNKHPAFRPVLDKWQAILDAIQAKPAILRRCIDKARANPDSLP